MVRCVVVVLLMAWHSLMVRLPLRRLQMRCMSRVLSRAYGDPPRERGRSSSTSGRMSCGTQPAQLPEHLGPCFPGVMVRVLSTHPPHNAQWVSSASTRARSCRRL